ncbi:MAG: HAMP domain-containing protein [Nitrospiraceae bacterium]|nr:MAG: HAMP domain-containing protein [Nitrospiraceae bacterium]
MQLKIWHKMIIGISIPVLLALIGGLWAYGYIDDVKKRHGYVQIAADLREDILEVRRNEKNYMHYKDAEHFRYLSVSINTFIKAINGIPPATVAEIGKSDLMLLDSTSDGYTSIIRDLHDNFQLEMQSIERVRREGKKLETLAASGEHAAGLSSIFILNLRRLEKNYMLFRDKDSLAKLDGALSQMEMIVPSCNECRSYIAAIRYLFVRYEENDSIISELQVAGNTLEDITDRIALRERQYIDTFFSKTQRLMLVALILLCTLGPLFVYRTATNIVAPIIRLTEITKKIAEGDSSVRAPIKEHDETYTLALSFNTMLDHLQLSHKSLEKSMALLREKQEEVEKCASVGLLVSGVAHEMNDPLNNISLTAGPLRLAQEQIPSGIESEIEKRNDFSLRVGVEIDQEITATDNVHFGKGRVGAGPCVVRCVGRWCSSYML